MLWYKKDNNDIKSVVKAQNSETAWLATNKPIYVGSSNYSSEHVQDNASYSNRQVTSSILPVHNESSQPHDIQRVKFSAENELNQTQQFQNKMGISCHQR